MELNSFKDARSGQSNERIGGELFEPSSFDEANRGVTEEGTSDEHLIL